MTVLALCDLFAVTELAEYILLELPIQEILVTGQRVSKQWKDIIDCSPRLQQALFLQPLPGNLVQLCHTNSPVPEYYFAEAPDSRTHVLTIGNPFIEMINVTRYGRQSHLVHRVEASFRRMLVCQPPVSVISFPRLPSQNAPWRSGTAMNLPPHEISREEGILLRQALFEDEHIKRGFSGVADELQHFRGVKTAWEVQRIEKDA